MSLAAFFTTSFDVKTVIQKILLSQLSLRRYLALLVTCLIGAGVITASTHFFFGAQAMIHCDTKGLNGSNYISYCGVLSFTEYDLGAFYFGLEPEAIRSLQKADVVFLGNSRTGHTFSSDATSTHLQSLGASYYVLGFGYEASSTVALALIKQFKLNPKAIVINADPFFTSDFKSPREKLLNGGPSVYLDYVTKKYFIRLQSKMCRLFQVWCGNAPTIYRSVIDCRWQVDQFVRFFANDPRIGPFTENPANRANEISEAVQIAEVFKNGITVPSECIIVTTVPSPHSTADLARAAAAAIGASYIAPQMERLTTFDDSHLLPESGERWSAAMLDAASSRLRRCLDRR